MLLLKKIIPLCLVLLCFAAKAQLSGYGYKVQKTISSKSSFTITGIPLIVPNSFLVANVNAEAYTFNYNNLTLTWLKPISVDSVQIEYRVFPPQLTTKYKGYNYDSIKNNFLIAKPFVFNEATLNNTFSDNLFNAGNINYNGSLGRSLSFGNNQDAVFNSQLNLQINGLIGDSIEIAAAITDNNIPIQPDGNTQRLNEFDRILLQFKKRKWELNLGDIDVRQNQFYFLNFYKRLQGVSYSNTLTTKKNVQHKLQFAGAVAKGKFTRNVFNGQEGNQGPYRLQTPNNDFFFAVLAGTERVFIDGELLQRGEDQDYVINYNTAELTFTPKRMITKDRRIQVEFEYADRNYVNTIIYAGNQMQLSKKLSVNIGLYSTGDAKNSAINQTLDASQKQFLANIGDSVNQAFYPFATKDTFATNKILYAKRANPINPILDSIFVYSNNKDSAIYNLSFTEVGLNKGNYIPLFNGANGRVFVYVAPLLNVKQGNYEPAQFLITPKTQQVATINTIYTPNATTTITTDIAISNVDVNTFSRKDKTDNTGLAAKFLLQKNSDTKKPFALTTRFGYEYVHQQFRALERLRSVEFSRDWGLPILPNFATEHLPKLGISYSKKQTLLSYTVDGYFRNDGFNAVKQTLVTANQFKGWQLNSNISLVNNNTLQENGYFFRPTLDAKKTFTKLKNISAGVNYALENSILRFKNIDSINPTSFAFSVLTAYIKSDATKANNWSFNYFTRADKLPTKSNLVSVDRSHNYNLVLSLLKNQKHQYKFSITYRTLQVFNTLSNQKADNSLLGRTEYAINELKGFLVGNILYETGAGQEQRRDFSFIEVPAGRGEYTWIDYNNDGIQQLNEFEIARFNDQAKFVRVFTPTNTFVKATYAQFNYSISLFPKALLKASSTNFYKKFVSKLVFQSALQTGNKLISNGNIRLNPFVQNENDTALIQYSNNNNHTLSFNRGSSKWGIDVSNNNATTKALLTYGFETRENKEYAIRFRFNIKQQYSFECLTKQSQQTLLTPKFGNRNFDINSQFIEPKISYTNSTKYRIALFYQYQQKQNAVAYGGEKALQQSINIEAKYNAVQSTSLSAKFTSNNINYTGAINTTTSYQLLEGLLPGNNLLWSIDFIKRLGNNLEINFNYEGRKPGETRVINIGRASIRAIL